MRQRQSEEERAAYNRQNRDHMAEVGVESNYSMMMMTKTFLSSIISKVRQDQSEEERAARLAQDRTHHAEVGGLLLFFIICCSTI